MRTPSLAFTLFVGAALSTPAFAQAINQVGDVFVIDMENHNLVQPNPTSSPQQILANPAAPYLNSLMTPGNPNSAQVSFSSADHNVLAGPNGAIGQTPGVAGPNDIHPSEPNYLWQQGLTNFGIQADQTVTQSIIQAPALLTAPSLAGALQQKGISWMSYQEDTDLLTTTGQNGSAGNGVTNGAVNANGSNLTSTVAPKGQYTVPLVGISGTSSSYVNPYNGSNQYNFATKHDGTLYFGATNGITNASVNGGVTTNAQGTGTQDAANPESQHYAPLQQLSTDLANNTVGRYNLITPDQFNDAHTGLTGGFTYMGTHFTGDQAAIAQGDNFLSILIPEIEASQAYLDNGLIEIWFDESEGSNPDTLNTEIPDIIISPLAVGNAFDDTTPIDHTSDDLSLEQALGLGNAIPLDPRETVTSDIDGFLVPEPSSLLLMLTGAPLLLVRLRRKANNQTA
jgi:hypothetical protein